MKKDEVWLVTGSSTGFGRALVEELIAQDYKVVATARQLSTLSELPDKENILKISLDVTKGDSIQKAVAETIAKFGRIDVLVKLRVQSDLAFLRIIGHWLNQLSHQRLSYLQKQIQLEQSPILLLPSHVLS